MRRLKELAATLQFLHFSIKFKNIWNSYKALNRDKVIRLNTQPCLSKEWFLVLFMAKAQSQRKLLLEEKILKKLMNTGSFYSTIIDIDINGKVEKILPKQLQYHPIK